jgi:hypothetical protein
VANYAGLAISGTMFSDECVIRKNTHEFNSEVEQAIASAIPCFNAGHKETIKAIRDRYGLQLSIPETPPTIFLKEGDTIWIIQITGLPRCNPPREYTKEEVTKAEFKINLYSVESV